MNTEEFKKLVKESEEIMSVYQVKFNKHMRKVEDVAEDAKDLYNELSCIIDEVEGEVEYMELNNILNSSGVSTDWLPSDYQC